MKEYSTATNALLNSGAIPIVINADMAALLSLIPLHTSMKLRIANEEITTRQETLKVIPITFGQNVAKLISLVVGGSPVDFLIGYIPLYRGTSLSRLRYSPCSNSR